MRILVSAERSKHSLNHSSLDLLAYGVRRLQHEFNLSAQSEGRIISENEATRAVGGAERPRGGQKQTHQNCYETRFRLLRSRLDREGGSSLLVASSEGVLVLKKIGRGGVRIGNQLEQNKRAIRLCI